MNFYDKEKNIVKDLINTQKSNISLFRFNKETIQIADAVISENFDDNWVDNSGKGNPPPDFYSDKFNLMLEVMRVDDHAHFDEKGKLINPTLELESRRTKEVFNSKWYKELPNKPEILVTASTALPSYEDHNYRFYYQNFQRVLQQHISKISNYKLNHPEHKIIFLVFDESTSYGVVESLEEANKNYIEGDLLTIQLHHHVLDKRFATTIINSNIDYLIWFTPYKHIDSLDGPLEFPKVTIIKISDLREDDLIDYDDNLIISTEE